MNHDSTSYQPTSFASAVSNNFALIVLSALFFVGGFFIGSLWTENKMLRGGTGTQAAAPVTDPATTEPAGPTADQLKGLPLVKDDDHIIGDKNAEIVLIEYTDFECPYCAQFHPTTKQVLEEYGDKVALVYRNYPLDFHPNAQKGGEAGECIAKLSGNDAYWKYADAIFAENDKLGGKISPDAITTAAQASGVNMTNFQKCLDSDEMKQVVIDDMNEGAAAGVAGTPGTFIVTKDGAQELIPGALPFARVKPMLDKYLN